MLSESLKRLREQRAIITKPFPLWALLCIYEQSNRRDTYANYFEGLKLLVNWLGPVDCPAVTADLKIPKLLHTYDAQEIARILNTKQEVIYHELFADRHSNQIVELFKSTNTAFLPEEISTKET